MEQLLQRRLASLRYLRAVVRGERFYFESVRCSPAEVAACAPGGVDASGARSRMQYMLALSVGRCLSLAHPLLLLRAACQTFHELEHFSGDGGRVASVLGGARGDDGDFYPSSLPRAELEEEWACAVGEVKEVGGAPLLRPPVKPLIHRAEGAVVYEFLLVGRVPLPYASLDLVEVLSSLLEALEELVSRLLRQARSGGVERVGGRSTIAGGQAGGKLEVAGGLLTSGDTSSGSSFVPGRMGGGSAASRESTSGEVANDRPEVVTGAVENGTVTPAVTPGVPTTAQSVNTSLIPSESAAPPALVSTPSNSHASAEGVAAAVTPLDSLSFLTSLPNGEDALRRLDRHIKHYVIKPLTLQLEAAAALRIDALTAGVLSRARRRGGGAAVVAPMLSPA